MRGIVTAPEIKFTQERDLILRPNPSSVELRKYVLYWDQIAVARVEGPESGMKLGGVTLRHLVVGDLAITQDLTELHDASVLSSFTVKINPGFLNPPSDDADIGVNIYGFRGSQVNEATIGAKVMLAQHLNSGSQDGSSWSVGHSGDKLILPPGAGEAADNLTLDLTSGLPIPSDETHMAEILRFRERRRSELLAFRKTMSDLNEAILKSPDQNAAFTTSLEQVERALMTIDRLLDESAIKKLFSGLSVFLRTGESPALNILASTALALGVAAGTPTSVVLGALAGIGGIGANAMLSIAASPNLVLPDEARDFAYLYHAKKKWRR